MPLNVIFMGTPAFSLPALEQLIKNNFNILAVYTQPPKKSKRGQKINTTPIEDFSKKNKLNIKNPNNLNDDEQFKIFKNLSPDLVIVVAYGQIIPKIYLEMAKYGFINIHASLLPKWRGAAPIQRAIMNRDKKIGVTIMKIIEKLDSGPIICSKEMNLNRNSTYGEVESSLSVMGANLLIEALQQIQIKKADFKNQINSEATYAKKINKNESKINWNLNAEDVVAHIHGLSPNPGAWFEYKNSRFKVLRARQCSKNGKPGLVIDDNLVIGCKSNSVEILEIQKQGKNKQLTKEFLLGNKITKGTNLK